VTRPVALDGKIVAFRLTGRPNCTGFAELERVTVAGAPLSKEGRVTRTAKAIAPEFTIQLITKKFSNFDKKSDLFAHI
jgi:hypothetical protein